LLFSVFIVIVVIIVIICIIVIMACHALPEAGHRSALALDMAASNQSLAHALLSTSATKT